jgi:hypothetical protein
MTEAIKIIWERDGLKGFRRGMSARVVTFAPSTAISWLSYEFFSKSRQRFESTGADGCLPPRIVLARTRHHLRASRLFSIRAGKATQKVPVSTHTAHRFGTTIMHIGCDNRVTFRLASSAGIRRVSQAMSRHQLEVKQKGCHFL